MSLTDIWKLGQVNVSLEALCAVYMRIRTSRIHRRSITLGLEQTRNVVLPRFGLHWPSFIGRSPS